MTLEFWVMRVLLHPGRPIPLDQHAAVMAYVERGELCILPDSCICEPIEVFANQLDAHAHREQLAADKPSEDFRVVLNTSVTV